VLNSGDCHVEETVLSPFTIVQGSVFDKLRINSSEALLAKTSNMYFSLISILCLFVCKDFPEAMERAEEQVEKWE